MPQLHELSLVRHRLRDALEILPPSDVTILLDLALRADPATGRLAVNIEDVAVRLATREGVVRAALDRLARFDFLERVAREDECEILDLGDLLVRRGAPPANLPVAPPI